MSCDLCGRFCPRESEPLPPVQQPFLRGPRSKCAPKIDVVLRPSQCGVGAWAPPDSRDQTVRETCRVSHNPFYNIYPRSSVKESLLILTTAAESVSLYYRECTSQGVPTLLLGLASSGLALTCSLPLLAVTGKLSFRLRQKTSNLRNSTCAVSRRFCRSANSGAQGLTIEITYRSINRCLRLQLRQRPCPCSSVSIWR